MMACTICYINFLLIIYNLRCLEFQLIEHKKKIIFTHIFSLLWAPGQCSAANLNISSKIWLFIITLKHRIGTLVNLENLVLNMVWVSKLRIGWKCVVIHTKMLTVKIWCKFVMAIFNIAWNIWVLLIEVCGSRESPGA